MSQSERSHELHVELLLYNGLNKLYLEQLYYSGLKNYTWNPCLWWVKYFTRGAHAL